MLTIRVLLRRLLVVPGVLALAAFFFVPLRDADPWLLDSDPRIAPEIYYETQNDARLTAADAVVSGASLMHRVMTVQTAQAVATSQPAPNRSLTALVGARSREESLQLLQERAPLAITVIAIAALTPAFAIFLIARGASTSARRTPTAPAVFLAASMFAVAALIGVGGSSGAALKEAWPLTWGGSAWIWLNFALVGLLSLHFFTVVATRKPAGRRR